MQQTNQSRNGHSEPANFKLHRDGWGRLVLTEVQGRMHVGIIPVRAFPLTDPRNGIALCDAEARELLWIDELDAVPQPTRSLLEEELARNQFLPILRQILRVSTREPSQWDVETDRGRTSFLLASDEDVHRFADHRAIIIDSNRVRYLIPDIRSLDSSSRRILERYL